TGAPKEAGVAVRLQYFSDLHPLRHLVQLLRGDDKRHAVKPPLQLILARIRFVVDKIVVLIIIVAILVHLSDDAQAIWVIEIKEELNRFLAATHLHQFASDYRQ